MIGRGRIGETKPLQAVGPNGRVAIVDGCRTPFGKAGGRLAALSSLDLATLSVQALSARNDLSEGTVDSLILGSVLIPADVPYLARQTGLALGWNAVDAYSAECACATGARAIVNGANQIAIGEYEVVVAGGAESLSQWPVYASPRMRDAVLGGRGAAGLDGLLSMTLGDLVPPSPQVTEPYSGRTLLDHAEEMVADWRIPRGDSDAFAVASHKNASAAWNAGILDEQVIPVTTPNGDVVTRDELVRDDASIDAVAKLEPVMESGTITAASASRLSDGGSAVLLMSERAAEAAGKTPTAFLDSWAFTSQDPALGALIGPAFALMLALARAQVDLGELDLVDFHEAFAGQVLVNLRALESPEFMQRHFGLDGAPAPISPDRLNVNGGSIALGHPFGATGGRLVTQSVAELHRRSGRRSALAICAGGARGAALVFEAP